MPGAYPALAARTLRVVEQREIDTPHGLARAHVSAAGEPRALLVLGHGAGGGVTAPDLVIAAEEAVQLGISVALVEQPYRVAGRKSPAPAHQLDAAWLAVVAALRGEQPVLCGGRSSRARVACRTAAGTGAAGVLCLAFPLHPPGRPEKTRLGELEAVAAPVLIVQGESDPFGMPPEAPGREVVRLRGNHGLKSDRPGLRAAVSAWLERRLTESA
jgi:predicted alpha/beta-hydrolase family hydrolase